MKKLLSIFLSLLVFIVCVLGNAVAEEFSVRNGIHFGMTIDEIISVEAANGLTKYDKYDYTDLDPKPHISFSSASVAGLSASIYYYCDENAHLEEIQYNFGNNKSGYDSLSASLVEKYGEPLHSSSTDYSIFPIYSNLIQGVIDYGRNVQFNEWLHEYNSNFVLIDIVYYQEVAYGISTGYFMSVSYKSLEKEDVMKLLVDTLDQQEKQESEKERDL